MSAFFGKGARNAQRHAAPSTAAITARAAVRKKGDMSRTASLVAGKEPPKISTAMAALTQAWVRTDGSGMDTVGDEVTDILEPPADLIAGRH